jgi:hypothetical protein
MLLKTQSFNHISDKNGYRQAILFSYNVQFLRRLVAVWPEKPTNVQERSTESAQ